MELLTAEQESAAWRQAMAWFGPGGRYAGRFGGGIVSLKLLYPLLDKFNESGLGLSFQLHTDKPPSFGYWMSQQATTLFEFWSNSEYTFDGGLNSFNHIMCKGSRFLCVSFRLKKRLHRRRDRQLVLLDSGWPQASAGKSLME